MLRISQPHTPSHTHRDRASENAEAIAPSRPGDTGIDMYDGAWRITDAETEHRGVAHRVGATASAIAATRRATDAVAA